MDGWRREHVLRRDRPAVGACRRPTCRRSTRRSSIRAPCSSRGRTCRKGAARRGRSSSSARRGIAAERFADAMNRLDLPGVRLPAGGVRADVPQARARERAAAARSTCSIASAFRPVETGVALLAAFRAADPDRFRWRDPPYEYEHTKLPIDILAGSSELREQIEAGRRPRRSHGRGRRRSRHSTASESAS